MSSAEQRSTKCCHGCDPSCEGPAACADRAWNEVERLRAAGNRLAAAVNAVACSGPRDEMIELTEAYIDWEARCG